MNRWQSYGNTMDVRRLPTERTVSRWRDDLDAREHAMSRRNGLRRADRRGVWASFRADWLFPILYIVLVGLAVLCVMIHFYRR